MKLPCVNTWLDVSHFDDAQNPSGDFLGSPVVETLTFSAGVVGLISGWGTKIPHILQPKKSKHKAEAIIITNSIKTLNKWSISKKSFKRNQNLQSSVSSFK